MSKDQNMDEQLKLMMVRLTALEKENAELKQLKRSGRAIDEFALNQTDLILENNITKLYSIYMMLSLVFDEEPYYTQIRNYIQKIKLSGKLPTLKTMCSLIARVSKSLNLTKKQDEESTDIVYKQDPLNIENSNDDEEPF